MFGVFFSVWGIKNIHFKYLQNKYTFQVFSINVTLKTTTNITQYNFVIKITLERYTHQNKHDMKIMIG